MAMPDNLIPLAKIFEGWDGYQTSIVHAVQLLKQEQLTWRPVPNLRSVGEVASHIAIGRIGWFARMPAPGSLELQHEAEKLGSEIAIAGQKDEVLRWLEASWQMIEQTLNQWTVEDLSRTYMQEYWRRTYSISFHWTIWRILTHDLHHGGELALMLGMQGIKVHELGDLGGHINMPPLAELP